MSDMDVLVALELNRHLAQRPTEDAPITQYLQWHVTLIQILERQILPMQVRLALLEHDLQEHKKALAEGKP